MVVDRDSDLLQETGAIQEIRDVKEDELVEQEGVCHVEDTLVMC